MKRKFLVSWPKEEQNGHLALFLKCVFKQPQVWNNKVKFCLHLDFTKVEFDATFTTLSLFSVLIRPSQNTSLSSDLSSLFTTTKSLSLLPDTLSISLTYSPFDLSLMVSSLSPPLSIFHNLKLISKTLSYSLKP